MMKSGNEVLVQCRCHDLAHTMALWFVQEDEDFDDYSISMVVPWMPWRYRFRQARNILFGRKGVTAFVSLDAEDLQPAVDHMQAFIAAQQAKADTP